VTTIVTFFFSVGLILLSESFEKKKHTTLLVYLIPLIYAVLFYYTLTSINEWSVEIVTYIVLSLSGFVAFVFVAPFFLSLWKKRENNPFFYNYFTAVSWTFLMSAIIGLSLLALGFIAISSVLALFDIAELVDEWKLFGNWAVISLALIAPLYGLIHLPETDEYEKEEYTDNKFFSFLIRYIATPFIYIYFIILYAYTAKVLLNFSDWPKWVVSWMVVGFSSFGYLIYIFSKAYEEKSQMIHFFRKQFAYVAIPQVAMLFYAIYLRIAQYDITMNRYFVVVFGLWLTLISLYYIFSKRKYLSIIPSSLVVIILIISVGPWSVYSFPLSRQYARLERNLEQANILKNWVITPLVSKSDISKDLSNEIYRWVEYVCNFDDCSRIKELFAKELVDAAKKSEEDWKRWNIETGITYKGMTKWEIISAVTDMIKVEADYAYGTDETEKYIQFNTDYNIDAPYPLDLDTGYTKLVKVYGERYGATWGYPYIIINPDTSEAVYHRGTGDVIRLAFPTPGGLTNTIPTTLDQKDLTFTLTADQVDMKIYLQSYAIRNPEYTSTGWTDKYDYFTINGIGLVREK
jgi:Domain of unknown function (DUF4153)